MVLKRVSQEAFDAAVKENMEEFDTKPEEALEATITDFKLQGVDLSGIIKRVSTNDQLSLDVKGTIDILDDAVAANNAAKVADAAKQLTSMVAEKYMTQRKEVLAAIGTKGGVMLLIRATEQALAAKDVDTMIPVLTTLTELLEYQDNKKLFSRTQGIAALHQAWGVATDTRCRAAVCLAVASASKAFELVKGEVMDCGLAEDIVQTMDVNCIDPDAIGAFCEVLTSLTTADDPTAVSSRAFPNSRRLASWGAAIKLTTWLRLHDQQDSSKAAALVPLCKALRSVAANDDICKEAAEAGALAAIALLLKQALPLASVGAAMALLKQLANCDVNKSIIMAAGGAELMLNVLSSCQDNADVVEQVFGALSVLTLRNPEAAERLLDCGVMDIMLDIIKAAHERMQGTPGKKEKGELSAVLRQGCMAWRNSVSRSPIVRQALMERGAVVLLRSILAAAYAESVLEAASACLRDFGVDDYHVPAKK